LLGRGVTDTVRSKIVDQKAFEDQPEILAFGMLCALTAAGTWLLVATYFELPVSTTHSIIGCATVRPDDLPVLAMYKVVGGRV
jgi:phosphate/sulfate permease